jgi:hypothetical protein
MKTNDKTTKTVTKKKTIKIIVEPVYIGKQSLSEAFMPVIYDELIKRANPHTFDRFN